MNSNIEVLLNNVTPWYLQMVSRYEHSDLSYDCTEEDVAFHGTMSNQVKASGSAGRSILIYRFRVPEDAPCFVSILCWL